MFSTPGTYTGNLGGRGGADAICQSHRPPSYNHFPEVRAFISVSSGDTISNMPNNFKIPDDVSIKFNGNQHLGNGWYDLLDSNIYVDLASAGAPGDYWTGANPAGGDSGVNCLNWTDNTGGQTGRVGEDTSNSATWLDNASPTCATPHYVLCVAYYPLYD